MNNSRANNSKIIIGNLEEEKGEATRRKMNDKLNKPASRPSITNENKMVELIKPEYGILNFSSMLNDWYRGFTKINTLRPAIKHLERKVLIT